MSNRSADGGSDPVATASRVLTPTNASRLAAIRIGPNVPAARVEDRSGSTDLGVGTFVTAVRTDRLSRDRRRTMTLET
jgi:hypothetical protein